jgi:hypothetical protein|tara:strand:+ start:923 stop:1045 length:123 start_codon:yes stop_codon:yes gene_type:complete
MLKNGNSITAIRNAAKAIISLMVSLLDGTVGKRFVNLLFD